METKKENILPIVKNPHNVLRKTSAAVPVHDIAGGKIRELIAAMKATLAATPDGVGLAAPQAGKSLAIFIVSEEAKEIDRAQKGGWERRAQQDLAEIREKPYGQRPWRYYVFINPVIKNTSRKKQDGPEGCLSVPGKFGMVSRHEKITVSAYDETGGKFTRGAAHFFARVIQHELDHLNGILFVDKAQDIVDVQKNGKRT